MNITTYHSSSAGNLYQADDLLIEAGVSIKEIKRCLNYQLSNIRACLITHSHNDHSRGARHLLKAGVDVYTSRDVIMLHNLSGHRLHEIEPGEQFTLGPWAIMPFDAIHDAPNVGFLIARGKEKLLFLIDTHYCPCRFKGLTHIMIEAGYDKVILQQNIKRGFIDPVVGKRILCNHMSIETALGLLRANDLSRVQEIHLLHLSQDNSNADDFKHRIQGETGVPVYVAPA